VRHSSRTRALVRARARVCNTRQWCQWIVSSVVHCVVTIVYLDWDLRDTPAESVAAVAKQLPPSVVVRTDRDSYGSLLYPDEFWIRDYARNGKRGARLPRTRISRSAE